MTQTAMDFSVYKGRGDQSPCADCGCRGAHFCVGKRSGAQLRDAALARCEVGRGDQIARIRVALSAFLTLAGETTFTADDVYNLTVQLGYGGGDMRWTGNVCRGWAVPTGRYVPSTLAQRHCRPVMVWTLSKEV